MRKKHTEHESQVSAVIWPWRAKKMGKDHGAEVASRRKRAMVESLVAYGVGFFLLFGLQHPRIAAVVFGIATLSLIGGLFVEPLYRAFRKLGHCLALGVGVGMTWLLLAPFFYVCFTVGRIFLLLLHRDPLNRAFPTKLPTYWSPYRPLSGTDSYTRQY